MKDTDTAVRKTDLIEKRNGVNSYGLHLEFVRYETATGALVSQVQLFLADTTLFVYERKSGKKTARWQSKKYDTQNTAREAMNRLLKVASATGTSIETRGVPTLVQLAETDVKAVNSGLKPTVRFDAGLRNVRLFGKVNDLDWRPANV